VHSCSTWLYTVELFETEKWVSKTRAIRFSEGEEKLIEEFLHANPFFDFSTLARMAILNFVKNPKMTIRPVGTGSKPRPERRAYGQS
jgi:hypothetical protein